MPGTNHCRHLPVTLKKVFKTGNHRYNMAKKDSPKWFKTLNKICGLIIAIGIIFYLVEVLICSASEECYAGPVFSFAFAFPIGGLALLVLIVAWIIQKFKK